MYLFKMFKQVISNIFLKCIIIIILFQIKFKINKGKHSIFLNTFMDNPYFVFFFFLIAFQIILFLITVTAALFKIYFYNNYAL